MSSLSRHDTTGEMREIQAGLERLERKEWWRWALALFIMLLLTIGLFSLSLPAVRKEVGNQYQTDLAVRGLLALVIVFDVFVIHQQVVISRLRRELAGQIGILATLEAIKPASQEEQNGWRERRRSPRHPFDQRLKITATCQGKEVVFHGRIIDISEQGLGAVISGSLERADTARLEFPAENTTLRVAGIVRYGHGFRHGFEFTGLLSSEVEILKRVCEAVAAAPVA